MESRRKLTVPRQFEAWGQAMGFPTPRRCGEAENKLPLWEAALFRSKGCDCRFEFGDLGYSRGNRHVIVEWESMSGVANWAKYLAFVAETPGAEVRLLHVYQKMNAVGTPETHLLSHRTLQTWLSSKLVVVTKGQFVGEVVRWPDDSAAAERLFHDWGLWLMGDAGASKVKTGAGTSGYEPEHPTSP